MFPNKTLPAWPESKSSHQPESPTANEAGDARYLSTGRAVPITYGLVPSANPAMLSTLEPTQRCRRDLTGHDGLGTS